MGFINKIFEINFDMRLWFLALLILVRTSLLLL